MNMPWGSDVGPPEAAATTAVEPRATSQPSIAELVYVCVAIALCTGGLNQLVASPTRILERLNSGESSWVARLLVFPAYFYVAAVFNRYPRRFLTALRSTGLFLVLILMCVASAAWSLSPTDTLLHAALLVAVSLFAVALATRFTRLEIIQLLCWTMILLFATEVVTLFFAPQLAIHQDELYPAVRGLFLHKNIAGRTYLIGVIAGLTLVVARRSQQIGLLALGSSLAAILLSLSATSLLVSIVIAVAFPLLLFYRSRPTWALVLLVVTLGGGAVLYLSGAFETIYVGVLGGLGKDTTLSNRTFIWETLIGALQRGPWKLGFGYEGFWTSRLGAVSVFDARYFVPAHAHNGLLQTAVALGVVGAGLLILALVRLLRDKFELLVRGQDNLVLFDVGLVLYFCFTNISETSVLADSGGIWPVFLMVAAMRFEFKAERRKRRRLISLGTAPIFPPARPAL